MKRYLAADVGGTAVKLGLINETGEILEKQSFAVLFDGYRTPILETVLRAAESFLQQAGQSSEDLEAIGISATGQIDTRSGVVVGSAGHIDNYVGSDFKGEFSRRFGRPVNVCNDANSAVLGEAWIGAARGCDDVVMVTIGTGVGGGVIVGGRPLSGRIGIAGELGHITINRDGIACSCGNRGCLEAYASMSALVRAARELLPELPYAVTPEEINGRVMFEWYWAGQERIVKLVDDWIDCIADGLVGLTHIFNPEMLLLGGGVSNEGERFLQRVRERVFTRVMPRFSDGLKLEAAALGNDAGMIGAVRACQI